MKPSPASQNQLSSFDWWTEAAKKRKARFMMNIMFCCFGWHRKGLFGNPFDRILQSDLSICLSAGLGHEFSNWKPKWRRDYRSYHQSNIKRLNFNKVRVAMTTAVSCRQFTSSESLSHSKYFWYRHWAGLQSSERFVTNSESFDIQITKSHKINLGAWIY